MLIYHLDDMITGVYTYGAPMVGDAEFAYKFDG
jgi:hypothetical protein